MLRTANFYFRPQLILKLSPAYCVKTATLLRLTCFRGSALAGISYSY
ncbi:hypothetical protein RNAN_2939 [Rheinheimera nanhaiensis E407-8]|uniref:Uncharacterized protein n=1 Tax=Rheinheimera nanhaiensis E407-8 TaxID=562729 RepID=I1E0U8_9GAMM|nr:hypothetical protein RNAN_2939 [Rheinheimera nanhaiensis E407-8]